MLFAADIGNTNITLALHDGKVWRDNWRVYTDLKKTSDEYLVILSNLLSYSNVNTEEVTRVVISSVVPNLTRSIQKILAQLFDVTPLIIKNSSNSGLNKASIPTELGQDLLCNLAYAHHKHPDSACMIVDFGTALTFSTVSKTGEVKGVAIVPGLLTSVNSLFGNTAQLPQVELKIPTTVLGRTSEESIRAGIMSGYAGLVKTMIKETEKELGEKLFVIATGGLSPTIAPLIERFDLVDKLHTLNGLKLIWDLNN